jgi:hypothetical protein
MISKTTFRFFSKKSLPPGSQSGPSIVSKKKPTRVKPVAPKKTSKKVRLVKTKAERPKKVRAKKNKAAKTAPPKKRAKVEKKEPVQDFVEVFCEVVLRLELSEFQIEVCEKNREKIQLFCNECFESNEISIELFPVNLVAGPHIIKEFFGQLPTYGKIKVKKDSIKVSKTSNPKIQTTELFNQLNSKIKRGKKKIIGFTETDFFNKK